MTDRFLTADELADYTGLTQPAAQARWLDRYGIHHTRRADGQVRVTWAAVNRTADDTSARPRRRPNFDALRA